MKKLILPVTVFALGLAAAKFIFGVNVEELIEGFLNFLTDLLDGPG